MVVLGLVLWSVGTAAPARSEPSSGAVATTTTTAAAAATPVEIHGEGSWGPYQELVPWQNALIAAEQPVDLNYVKTGDLLGREDFVAGSVDFALSGPPFLASELAKVKGGAAGLISAPVQVESMGFLLTPPYPDGFQALKLLCDPTDPNIPDPSKCIEKDPYTGPIKVPVRNLAAMVVKYSGTDDVPLSAWNHPDVLKAMGVDNFTLAQDAKPAPVNRSDPSGTDYYLQQFIKTGAPDVWAGLQADDPTIHWEPVTERLGRQGSASRDGVDQQSLTLGLLGVDPASGGLSGFTAGTMAPVPASAYGVVHQAFPNAPITFVQTQNANGDWVAPTSDSITKAVAAGGETPLYALTHKVAGAYPLVWVNRMYVPAKGLSIDKTEALATIIRYLATDGQDAAAPVGEGKLSPALVKEALASADQVVSSNCVGAGRTIQRSSDPGPDSPKTKGMEAIGPMLHCVAAVPSATTTTTAPPTTTTASTTTTTEALIPTPDQASGGDPFADGGANSNTGGDDTPDATSPDAGASPSTTTTTTTPAKRKKRTFFYTLTSMPGPVPTQQAPGFDRFAALLVGIGIYLLAANPVRSLFRKRQP